MSTEQKAAPLRSRSQSYGFPAIVAALELPRSTWHYRQRQEVGYTDNCQGLWKPLETIARKHASMAIAGSQWS